MSMHAFYASRLPASFAPIRPAARVFPSGQANLPAGWQWGLDANDNPVPVDTSGNPLPLPTGATHWGSSAGIPVALDANGNEVSYAGGTVGGGVSGGGTITGSTAGDTALFNTVGQALNMTGQTIANIVNSNNQAGIAQLNAQTQLQIAQLNAQIARNQLSNPTLAAQQQAQMQQLMMFQQLLAQRSTSDNTTLWIIGGIAVIGIVGYALFSAKSAPTHSRRNPLRSRRVRTRRYRSRFYEAA